jgi:GNAT superfamily N-acetyltransferase
MDITFSIATEADVPAMAVLGSAVCEDLTARYGHGVWSSAPTERGLQLSLRHARMVIALDGGAIVGKLRLQTKKPWAIDRAYFTPVKKELFLTGMAVIPAWQRRGLGRMLIDEAVKVARAWPADSICLDAFDADAGAGGFYAKCGFEERGRVTYRKAPLIYFEMLL